MGVCSWQQMCLSQAFYLLVTINEGDLHFDCLITF